MEKCLNCGSVLHGKYCSNCGQERIIHRFNTKHLMEEFTHGIFHWESSILKTFKELVTRPGYFINEYIGGKRKRFVKPFSYFIFIQAVYVFVFHSLSQNFFEYMNVSLTTDDKILSKTEEIQQLINANVNYLNFIQPVIFAFFLMLFLRKKKGMNYAEGMVFSLYGFATVQIFGIALMLLSLIDVWIWNLRILVNLIYFPIAIYQFSGFSKAAGLTKGLLVTILNYLTFIILIAAATVSYMVFFYKEGL